MAPVGNVVSLPLRNGAALDSLDELVNGVADGFNRLVEVGKIDRPSVNVMVGYLSAGSIALRCTGEHMLGTVYVVKRPNGDLVPTTVVADRRQATVEAFELVSSEVPGFREKYWKRWEPAQRAVRKLGYKVAKCKLVEC